MQRNLESYENNAWNSGFNTGFASAIRAVLYQLGY